VLAPQHRAVLEQFACANVLAAFDYDGTLAPIAATPEQARMRESTRELFRRLSDSFPTVVISGREQADVDGRLEGLGLFAVIGNHGIEPWHVRKAYRAQAARWGAALRQSLRGLEGVWVEDKRYSVAAHYRQAARPAAARRRVLAVAAALPGARIVTGKKVCNVLPRDAPDKGAALDMARVALGCDAAIYVGDDDTDEDVFRLQPDWPLLTVRVGPRRGTRAAFHLRRQSLLDDLLDLLVRFRVAPQSLKPRR
jgi:trehalose 6-phosphate phosphatase